MRAADLLTKVKTEAEVLEWTGSYLQYYRETANFGERTSEWLQRIGLDTIKEALEKQEDRDALNVRIDKTLSLTTDPWKEIIESDKLSSVFEPLAAPEDTEAAAARGE